MFSGASTTMYVSMCVELVRLDLGQLREHRLVDLEYPGAERRAVDPHPQERVGAAAADPAADLLEQRPRCGIPVHEHLPARLHVDAALDEQARELLDSGVDHGRGSV